jgi:hypothetical protein
VVVELVQVELFVVQCCFVQVWEWKALIRVCHHSEVVVVSQVQNG